MSRARDLFEAIRIGGFSRVEVMVREPVTEELFLDYKRLATVHPAQKLHDSDRKNFAKAISGFGNSDGGIIVWGVDCRSVEGEGDIPTEFFLIPNAVRFKTMLDGLVSGMTLPPHGDVENFVVPKGDGPEGIVVSYIPQGSDVPMQSLVGSKVYYIRAGSSFEPTPHSVLAGMFGRRPQPLIEGKFEPESVLAVDSFAKVEIAVILTNSGRGVADDVHLSVDTTANSLSLEMHILDKEQWRARGDPSRIRWNVASNEQFQRHVPGENIQVMTVIIYIPRQSKDGLEIVGICGSRNAAASIFKYALSIHQLDQVAELVLHKSDNHKQLQLNVDKALEILRMGNQ